MLHTKNKILLSLTIVSLCILAATAGLAFEGKSHKEILDNGMTVVITEMPTSQLVSVFALVKTGSATEGKYLGSGISHFLEHMLFKGTVKRGVGEISEAIQAVGGTINASTGMDYTIYTITVPQEHFATALDILADSLMNSVLAPEEVVKEQEVIVNEMRLHNDNPDRKIGRWVFEQVFLRHPYRHRVIGYDDLFNNIGREELLDYYKTHYIPNNIVLSVAGNVESSAIMPQIKDMFKDFKRGTELTRNLPQEPEQISPRRYEGSYATDLARLSIAFPSVRLLHQDLFPLDVLAMILGRGKSSRLYTSLFKEKQLVYNISAGNYTPMDQGMFSISSTLEYENREAARKEIWEQIHKIQSEGVSDDELAKAKRQVLSEYIAGLQTANGVAYSQALDEAYTGDQHFSKRYVESIRKVTADDVKRVANQYLIEERENVVVLKPKSESKDDEVVIDTAQSEPIEKIVLDNDLTLLFRRDPSLPLVSVRIVVHGGMRQEPEDLGGLSNLTAYLWDKGTKSRDAKEISEMVESYGMSLGAYSGKNSFGLSIEFLSEDFDKALDLLDDVAQNPVFDEQEIAQAKDRINAMIRQRDDSIFQFTSHALREILFETHPFRREEEGTPESLAKINRDDIVDFYTTHFTPSNMVVSVFGDIDLAKAKEQIKKKFGTIKTGAAPLKNYSEAPFESLEEKDLTMDKQQTMLMLGFRGTTLDADDRYKLEVLTGILGSSFSGRMFSNIRDKWGKAYALGGYSAPGIDSGMILFYILTDEQSVEEAKELLEKEIEQIRTELVSDQELKDIKSYLKGVKKVGLQTNGSLGFTSSLDELYGLGFAHYQEYDELIDKVSKEDVKDTALKYLDIKRGAVVITRPSSNSEPDNET